VNECIYAPGTSNGAIDFISYNQMTNSGTGDLELFCPIVNETNIDAPDMDQVVLFGYKNAASGAGDITMAACRTYDGGGGGVCGSAVSQSTQGNFYLANNAGLGSWYSGTPAPGTNDAYYLNIYLPPEYEGSSNVIWSYSIQNFL
jgi:hypothetical protein